MIITWVSVCTYQLKSIKKFLEVLGGVGEHGVVTFKIEVF